MVIFVVETSCLLSQRPLLNLRRLIHVYICTVSSQHIDQTARCFSVLMFWVRKDTCAHLHCFLSLTLVHMHEGKAGDRNTHINIFIFNFPCTVPQSLYTFYTDIHNQSPPVKYIMIGTTVEFTAVFHSGDHFHWQIAFGDGQSMNHVHKTPGDPTTSFSFKVQHKYNSVSVNFFLSVLRAHD